MKQKQEIAIDKFNKNVIERVIKELKADHDRLSQLGDHQSGGFGAFQGINDDAHQASLLEGDESSFNETVRTLQQLWEKNFKNRC
jgi:hypothetical protein